MPCRQHKQHRTAVALYWATNTRNGLQQHSTTHKSAKGSDPCLWLMTTATERDDMCSVTSWCTGHRQYGWGPGGVTSCCCRHSHIGRFMLPKFFQHHGYSTTT